MICSGPDCEVEFVPGRPNQIYHNDACRIAALNKKLLAQYHERKRQTSRKRKRRCIVCGAALSQYNKSRECAPCSTAWKEKLNADLLERLTNVSS